MRRWLLFNSCDFRRRFILDGRTELLLQERDGAIAVLDYIDMSIIRFYGKILRRLALQGLLAQLNCVIQVVFLCDLLLQAGGTCAIRTLRGVRVLWRFIGFGQSHTATVCLNCNRSLAIRLTLQRSAHTLLASGMLLSVGYLLQFALQHNLGYIRRDLLDVGVLLLRNRIILVEQRTRTETRGTSDTTR